MWVGCDGGARKIIPESRDNPMSEHIGVSSRVRWRDHGNTGDRAAIVTMVNDDGTVQLTVFPPGQPAMFLTLVKVHHGAGPETCKPNHCYVW